MTAPAIMLESARCSHVKDESYRCRRDATRVWVTRSDDGRKVVGVRGFCDVHGSRYAIPLVQYELSLGRPPINPGTPQAGLLLSLTRREWRYLSAAWRSSGSTVGVLVRRGLVERERVHGRVQYRLTEAGLQAMTLLSVGHVYYGPGSHVFNTPAVAS